MTRPVVVAVSHATRASGSSRMMASRIASEIWSHILSGCPSVTDSEVNRYWDASTMLVIGLLWAFAAAGYHRGPAARLRADGDGNADGRSRCDDAARANGGRRPGGARRLR